MGIDFVKTHIREGTMNKYDKIILKSPVYLHALKFISTTTITICNGAFPVRLCAILVEKPVEDVGRVSPMSTGLAEDNRIIDGICIERHEQD